VQVVQVAATMRSMVAQVVAVGRVRAQPEVRLAQSSMAVLLEERRALRQAQALVEVVVVPCACLVAMELWRFRGIRNLAAWSAVWCFEAPTLDVVEPAGCPVVEVEVLEVVPPSVVAEVEACRAVLVLPPCCGRFRSGTWCRPSGRLSEAR
jgi:hypothetical protein